MAKLRIPDSSRKHLFALATATDRQIDQLCQVLAEVRPDTSLEDLPDLVVSKLSAWSGADVSSAVQSILGLCAFRAQSAQAPAPFADEVIAALKRRVSGASKSGPESEQALDSVSEERIRSVLLRLFSITNLDLASKALGILTDNQRSFVAGRILSDLRTVFHDDVSTGPVGAVIVHSLKLEYIESGDIHELFIALDSKDLLSIRELIERALQKDEALRKLLAQTRIPFMENK